MQLVLPVKEGKAPPCQGEAKKVSLWQAILNRVRSMQSALPK